MNEISLCSALTALVEEAVSEIRLPNKAGELVAPHVYNGFLPLASNDEELFPYVLICHESSATDWEGTSTKVAITAGAYCNASVNKEPGVAMRGHFDCLNVLSAVRTRLLDLPAETLDGRFVLMPTIDINTPAEQPFPYWQVDMTTKWHLPFPAMQHIREGY